jgi:hypothetical protein
MGCPFDFNFRFIDIWELTCEGLVERETPLLR